MLDAHPGSGHAVRHARVRVCVRVRGVFFFFGAIRAGGRASAIGRGALTRAPPARARSAPVVTTLPPHETRGAPRTRACVCGSARGYLVFRAHRQGSVSALCLEVPHAELHERARGRPRGPVAMANALALRASASWRLVDGTLQTSVEFLRKKGHDLPAARLVRLVRVPTPGNGASLRCSMQFARLAWVAHVAVG